MAAVVLVDALWCTREEREREPEEGRGMEERGWCRGAAWHLQGVDEARREAGGGGSRRWPRVHAQATRRRPSGARRRMTGTGPVGWAGQVSGPGNSLPLFSNSVSVF